MSDVAQETRTGRLRLVVERGRTVPFDELPPGSLALDGYVQGPHVDLATRRFSFDHHGDCLRMVTRASCQQVMDALLLGLDPSDLSVYVNDVDGDTALSVWLLADPGRVEEDEVRLLVESVGAVDAHGPAFPALRQDLADGFFAAAMLPEHQARRDGSYPTVDLEALLLACVEQIGAFVEGRLEVPAPGPPVAWTITHEGRTGWVMVEAEGFVFRNLYRRGITRAISWRRLPDGSLAYTVAKKSDLVGGFPVGPPTEPGTILGLLAGREPGWGGGSNIGGSPRNPDGSSSRLSPDEVFELVEELLTGAEPV